MKSDARFRMTVLMIALALAFPALAGCLGGQPPPTTPPPTGETPLKLILGTMNPLTGALSNLGPSMQNGAKLAIAEVNGAGTRLTIQAFHEDDKTTDTTAAPNTFNSLIAKGATAIQGPCCSGITGAILDLAVQNEVVVSSPSATSPALTLDRDNEGYFWRIAPSDAVQGKVLANLVAEDAVKTVRIVNINNAYGTGLATVFTQTFTGPLGGTVDKTITYDEGATTFSSQVTEACASPLPEAIVFVVYTDEGASILKEMQAQGCLAQVKIYASEGIYDAAGTVAQKAGQDEQGTWLAAGVKGTTPEAGSLDAWKTKYQAGYPNEEPLTYSAESYDAVMYVALATLEAKSVAGDDLVGVFLKIANAPGDACSGFKQCADLIKAGKDINYQGFAHDFDFDDRHEPKTGIYSWWEIQDDGTMETVATGKSA